MLGQLLFGETPIALIGKPPHVETGWIKQAKRHVNPDWLKKDKNHVETIEADETPINWMIIR